MLRVTTVSHQVQVLTCLQHATYYIACYLKGCHISSQAHCTGRLPRHAQLKPRCQRRGTVTVRAAEGQLHGYIVYSVLADHDGGAQLDKGSFERCVVRSMFLFFHY